MKNSLSSDKTHYIQGDIFTQRLKEHAYNPSKKYLAFIHILDGSYVLLTRSFIKISGGGCQNVK